MNQRMPNARNKNEQGTHDSYFRMGTRTNNNNNDKHAYAGQLDSFTDLRVLLVLHDSIIIIIIINRLIPVN
jgi:hypothetical protein